MRKVVLQFWVSLDGYSCDPGTELYRIMEEISDDEHEKYFVARLRQAGTHIMGRVTYQEMAEFWPQSGHPAAAPMSGIPKIVFSKTLQSVVWPESRIASGDTAHEIAGLKQDPGGEIIAYGGTRFARSLIRLGVVDEYRLTVLPVAIGKGAPLFASLARPVILRLVTSTAFPSGILELVYTPADRQDPGSEHPGIHDQPSTVTRAPALPMPWPRLWIQPPGCSCAGAGPPRN